MAMSALITRVFRLLCYSHWNVKFGKLATIAAVISILTSLAAFGIAVGYRKPSAIIGALSIITVRTILLTGIESPGSQTLMNMLVSAISGEQPGLTSMAWRFAQYLKLFMFDSIMWISISHYMKPSSIGLFFLVTTGFTMLAVVLTGIASLRGEGIISSRLFGGTGVEQMVLTTIVLPSRRRSFINRRESRGASYIPLESIVVPGHEEP